MTSDSLRERVAVAIAATTYSDHALAGMGYADGQNYASRESWRYLRDADAALAVVAEWMVGEEALNAACDSGNESSRAGLDGHDTMVAALAAVVRRMGEK